MSSGGFEKGRTWGPYSTFKSGGREAQSHVGVDFDVGAFVTRTHLDRHQSFVAPPSALPSCGCVSLWSYKLSSLVWLDDIFTV